MHTSTLPPVPSWAPVTGSTEILYEKADEGIAKITINRPEVRIAFRTETVPMTRPPAAADQRRQRAAQPLCGQPAARAGRPEALSVAGGFLAWNKLQTAG